MKAMTPDSMAGGVTLKVHPLDNDEDGLFYKPHKIAEDFVSPMKALAFNFRFNQVFGIFPGKISSDWNNFKLVPKMILMTFSIKAIFLSTILALVYVWLMEQGDTFSDFKERLTNNDLFTPTDTFVMISHFLFLQISALILYLHNLTLGPHLTKLCGLVTEFNARYAGSNPPAKKLMTYRISVCVLCTIASLILFTGIWNLTKNPDRSFGALDFAIILIIVVALYVENQNHMFSELLFLRFTDILDDRFNNFLSHLDFEHSDKASGRPCCVDHGSNLYKVYVAISRAFGGDLLVAVTILIISITFGFYLVLTFLLFIGAGKQPILFVVYILYSIIPSVRLYVLAEGANKTQTKMLIILKKLRKIEASAEAAHWDQVEAKQFSLIRTHFEKPKGYDAAGFFFLNRKFMSTVFGALVTYLIVLLQFKLSDQAVNKGYY